MKNLIITLALFAIPIPAIAMSQDPRTCADPRGQYPTPNPPCITMTLPAYTP